MTKNLIPYGDFILYPVKGYSLWLHQKGQSGPDVILPDRRTDGQAYRRTDGQMENGFKGIKFGGV